MAFFDATLFTRRAAAVPRARRGAAIRRPAGRRARRPTRAGPAPGRRASRAFLRLGHAGSAATATATRASRPRSPRTLRIHADHVLRGYEAVATRLMQTVAAAHARRPCRAAARVAACARRRGPAGDRPPAPPPLPGRAVPAAVRVHRRAAAPDAGRPGRRAGAADRALRRRRGARAELPSSRTRSWRTGSSASRTARWRTRAGRSGRSASTSRRSRSASTPRSTRAALGRDPAGDRRRRRSCRAGVTLDEVLATFRAIGAIQARFGDRRLPPLRRQLHRVAADVTDVLELAPARRRPATAPAPPVLDVVPAVRVEPRRSAPPARSSARCSTIRPTAPGSPRGAIARR